MPALVWFRRDLRLSDHSALRRACDAHDQVVPFYIISDWQKDHRWTGPNRQSFLCGSLQSLAKNIEAAGGKLIFRQGDAAQQIAKLAEETGAEAIYFNRDVDPFGIAMEEKVAAGCRERGMAVHSCKDAVLHERGEVLKGDGTPYRVYTPYSKAWHRLEKPAPLPRVRAIHTPKGIASLEPPTLATWNLPDPEADVIEPGERAARDRMRAALDGPLHRYSEDRDIPGGQTTSRLSQDLRLGLISIRELFAKADERARAARTAEERKAFQTYINELAWREFYMQILYHFPEVLEHEFNADYRDLKWSYDKGALERWKAGETGFPIVDAGMRQLRATGFMHNRVRMITAMFLTKDLHLDWRLGEEYFMQQLTDGEIASNNGGWQWSAGTGADAAPYFRIQNPWSQTKRFDPHGDYIKAWVPELKDVPAKKFLNPPEDGKPIAKGYPAPIVDHAEAREKTLAMFKAAK